MLRLVQISHSEHGRRVAVVEEPWLRLLPGCTSVYELAASAIQSICTLREVIGRLNPVEQLDYDEVYSGRSGWRLLAPIDHPEPSRCYVTGTGLTHKGSAESRQSMHVSAKAEATDSMKMFQIGLEGGRPEPGRIGAAPEWFYKGTGTIVRAVNEPLEVPSFGDDGGDEAEIAGVYLIGDDGAAFRIGLAQGNEFSDHRMEAKNYLYWRRRNCGTARWGRSW